MRIAQVSPLYESVPPKYYGGTERVVSYLTEELVRTGHDVTLFASQDSVTSAHLVPGCSQSLRLDPDCVDPLSHHFVMLERIFNHPAGFDIIHFHIDYLHFPLSRRQFMPHVTTLHGRLDLPDLRPLFEEYSEIPVISISTAQMAPLPMASWQGTVHHGLPEDLFTFSEERGDYLAFLGRISPEKRVDRAIEIARRVGMKLRIAAKVDRTDQKYFDETIKPLLDHPLVEFIGEIGEAQKNEFLGRAYALLFPIDWPEPFGLVVIESMACGTPVIAYPHGSVPEIIEDGVSGYIVSEIEEAVEAVKRVEAIDRRLCRDAFERRFTASRMARDYLAIYERVIEMAEISSVAAARI